MMAQTGSTWRSLDIYAIVSSYSSIMLIGERFATAISGYLSNSQPSPAIEASTSRT